jgi:hypothetical protein
MIKNVWKLRQTPSYLNQQAWSHKNNNNNNRNISDYYKSSNIG